MPASLLALALAWTSIGIAPPDESSRVPAAAWLRALRSGLPAERTRAAAVLGGLGDRSASQPIATALIGALGARTATDGFLMSECGQGMEIGFDVGNSPAETCASFQGVIDEVRIYSAVLSAEEIAAEIAAEAAAGS